MKVGIMFANVLLFGTPEGAEALDAATGWQVWEALRAHQKLSADRARGVLARIVRSLLA